MRRPRPPGRCSRTPQPTGDVRDARRGIRAVPVGPFSVPGAERGSSGSTAQLNPFPPRTPLQDHSETPHVGSTRGVSARLPLPPLQERQFCSFFPPFFLRKVCLFFFLFSFFFSFFFFLAMTQLPSPPAPNQPPSLLSFPSAPGTRWGPGGGTDLPMVPSGCPRL